MLNNSKIKLGILGIPVLVYFILFFTNFVNFPYSDDYDAILRFLQNFIGAEGLNEKFKLIWAQHNEHRIIYDRFWILLSYYFTGKVDFMVLAFIGNLSLIGIFYILFKAGQKVVVNVLYLLPISLLVFNMCLWENTYFAMASLQNFTVVLFALLTLYFLANTNEDKVFKIDFVLALCFFTLATYTSGSGFFIALIGVAIFILKRKYKHLFVWSAFSALIVGLYFLGYHHPEGHPKPLDAIQSVPYDVIRFFFAFLGSTFSYYDITNNHLDDSIINTSYIGGLFFVYFLYLTLIGYYKKNTFIYAVIVLVLMVAASSALTRTGFGVWMSMASRYRINTVVLVSVLYISLYELDTWKISHRIIAICAVIIAMCISFIQYPFISDHRNKRYSELMDYKFHKMAETDSKKELLDKSAQLGIYSIPDKYSLADYNTPAIPLAITSVTNNDTLKYNLERLFRDSEGCYLEGWIYSETDNTIGQEVFVMVKSAKNSYTFNTNKVRRDDVNLFFKSSDLEQSGFKNYIDLSILKPGVYNIILGITKNGQNQVVDTKQTIVL